MKVLHLPSSVGGNAWALSQGENALCLDSSTLSKQSSWLKYPVDTCLHLEQEASKFKKICKLLGEFYKIRKQYDIFHFNYGSSLIDMNHRYINLVDVPFYPSKAKLFVTYNGCDARQKYPTIERTTDSACRHAGCNGGICNAGRLDTIRQKKIKKMAKYVEHMWAVNPDLLYYLPKEKSSFLPYSIFPNLEFQDNDFEQKKLQIVHAPTNRIAKGTDDILKALNELPSDIRKYVDFKLIEQLPHSEALKLYQEADVVIDQINIGWYGGFAVECMYMGKPTICRIEKQDLHFIPGKMANDLNYAIIDCNAKSLTDTISFYVENRKKLKEKSIAAVEYAYKWHFPEKVAKITKRAYEQVIN